MALSMNGYDMTKSKASLNGSPNARLDSSNIANSNNIESNRYLQGTQQETFIRIYIEKRTFSLNLENFNEISKHKIISLFHEKHYTLEEILTLLITLLRDQSIAEQELANILKTLKS